MIKIRGLKFNIFKTLGLVFLAVVITHKFSIEWHEAHEWLIAMGITLVVLEVD